WLFCVFLFLFGLFLWFFWFCLLFLWWGWVCGWGCVCVCLGWCVGVVVGLLWGVVFLVLWCVLGGLVLWVFCCGCWCGGCGWLLLVLDISRLWFSCELLVWLMA
ncbi:hypothetical protein RA279_27950, partial [Pseudomonas syringae pv. tagetis]|uniref:hypothetical protein n=1 Tax=Pseudomonas syringae group genomosp. 7 TaxID=251699 RepID=UPI00376FBF0D